MTYQGKFEMAQILNRLETSVVDNNNLLQGTSINQRTDFKKISTKIVFSEKASKKLLSIVKSVISTDSREYGVYFFGNVYNGFVFFDDYGSDFALADGVYENGAVDVTPQNLEELDQKTEKRYTDKPCNAVMHFHTHPDTIYENGVPAVIHPLVMSQNDLYSYGFHQKYLQPESGNKVLYFGGMLSKNHNSPEFSIVTFDADNEEFYYMNDIFLVDNGELIRVDDNDFLNTTYIPLKLKEEGKSKILELISMNSDTNKNQS